MREHDGETPRQRTSEEEPVAIAVVLNRQALRDCAERGKARRGQVRWSCFRQAVTTIELNYPGLIEAVAVSLANMSPGLRCVLCDCTLSEGRDGSLICPTGCHLLWGYEVAS